MIQCVNIVSKKVTLVIMLLIHSYVYMSPLAFYIKSWKVIYDRKAVLRPVVFDTFHVFYLLHQNLCELCPEIQKMQNFNLGYSLLSGNTVEVSPIICD